ncbi:TPM domain-containing protein [Dongia sp.]|uniref:TPM domain-containing protein n=1 Tax=Dongia sp. TaxID=1977262 RepID=UPI003752B6A7
MVRILGLLILLTGFVAPALADPPIPSLTGRVVDQADILDASTVATITDRLAGLESSTGIQLVVVTLPDLKGYVIEDWGLALGRGWGIGQAGKNNGLLLIVAPNDRELRIEVGYGLEGQIPDATANSIIQREIIPYFKQGDMNGGVRAGVEAILAALGGGYVPTQPLTVQNSGESSSFTDVLEPLGIFAIAFLATVVMSLRRRYDPKRRRNVWYLARSSGGSSSSRSSGSSFRGGGGSFGGGGASGRW